MRGGLRRGAWTAGGVAVVGVLVVVAQLNAPADEVPPPTETITYELSGPPGATEVQYGDVLAVIFSPSVSSSVDRVALPWTLMVPMRGAPSSYDLTARADPRAGPLTCVVRRGSQVVATGTGLGQAGCDTTPATGGELPGR